MSHPDQVYYPSCVVNFRIRFDEELQVAVKMPQPEEQDGSSSELVGSGVVSGADKTAAAVTRQNLITQTGTDNLSKILNRVPKSASIESGNFRQAGTFTLRLDYRELPIDPRIIRACRVEIFQGAVPEQDFGDGMAKRGVGNNAVLGITKEDNNFDESLLVMTGLVDTWKVSHDAKGSWVNIEGRDLRGLLLDSPVNPVILSHLNYAQPIDKVVTSLLKTHPMFAKKNLGTGVAVAELDRSEWPNNTIPVPSDNEITPRRAASGNKPQMGVQSGKANYWDIITNLCFRVGALPYLRNKTLFIKPSRSIFKKVDDPRLDDSPFIGELGGPGPRFGDDGRAFFIRRMIYGRNIDAVNYERKYTGVTVPVIEIVSTDHSHNTRGRQKLLKQQWPTNKMLAAMTTSVSPDGLVGQVERKRIPVNGIRSEKRLLEIAKSLYEEIGRGSLGGSCRTKSLASFKGNNSDADLLRLKPGDAVEFAVDTRALKSSSPGVAELIDHQRNSFEEQVEHIKKSWRGKRMNVDENLIRVLVASSRSSIVDVLRYFRIYNIRWNWSDGKVAISFDFHNYFVARYEVTDEAAKGEAEATRKKKRVSRDRAKKQAKPKAPFNGGYVPPIPDLPRDRRGPRIGPVSRPFGGSKF